MKLVALAPDSLKVLRNGQDVTDTDLIQIDVTQKCHYGLRGVRHAWQYVPCTASPGVPWGDFRRRDSQTTLLATQINGY